MSIFDPHDFIDFYKGYVECALWSTIAYYKEDQESDLSFSDHNYYESDLHEKTRAQMLLDCASFIEGNYADLETAVREHGAGWDRLGHDFWLTRSSHGAGFWDHGWGELGTRLSRSAGGYGDQYLYADMDPEKDEYGPVEIG